MIQIQLKARHFYFISYYLRNASIVQYISLVNRIKDSLQGNQDMEQLFSVNATADELIMIYKVLTMLPEGQVNTLNVEMSNLLLPQIQQGVAIEITNGIVADENGNFPGDAHWQLIANGITQMRLNNVTMRNNAIDNGKLLIETI